MKKAPFRFLSLATAVLTTLLLAACEPDIPDDDDDNGDQKKEAATCANGLAYCFGHDEEVIPEIHVNVPLDEWNALLDAYDRNHDTRNYVTCNVRYVQGADTTSVDDVGLRLRGNTSRRRPEKGNGHHHDGKTHWQHFHLSLNFHKFIKDDAHTIHGLRRMNIKWFKDDPSYVREVFCYDLFRRAKVWTAIRSTYCRLWLNVGGDSKETYYGVHEMMEPIDDHYLKVRKSLFGSDEGFLWKGMWGCRLNSTKADFFNDYEGCTDTSSHAYILKTQNERFDEGVALMKDFIKTFNSLNSTAFHDWIAETTDVELLLRTCAVNVAVGMWDDYWNNCNNCYFYILPANVSPTGKMRFYFIPYDYDNTLGTTSQCGVQSDAMRQDPLHWGDNANPLFSKLLTFEDYRQIYIDALKKLVDISTGLMHWDAAIPRIKTWQQRIEPFVDNDTGEDTTISDRPASWGNHSEYRLTEMGGNNVFRVKKTIIEKLR